MAQLFSLLLGQSAWDCVPYVRNLVEDTTAPFVIPDAAIQVYAEDVLEDFSRHVPLDNLVGNPSTNTSTMNTVANQQRYVCSVANGFSAQIMGVSDVLYRAGTGYSAASEIAYLALLPFSPINRFLFTPSLLDSPTERILRDEYLSELEHYGYGYYNVVRDAATGLPALDLYPIPVIAGLAIYVRYQTLHIMSQANEDAWTVATVPEPSKRNFAKLLAAMVMEQEADRIIKVWQAKGGLVDVQSDSRSMELRVERWRQDAYNSMGGRTAVGVASHS